MRLDDKVIGYHWGFTSEEPDTMIRQQDGAKISTLPGTIEAYDGEEKVELCRKGLHASEALLDSLTYAEGCLLRRVEISGEVVRGADKAVGRKRVTLWSLDLTNAQVARAEAHAAHAEEIADILERKEEGTANEEELASVIDKAIEARLRKDSLRFIVAEIEKAGFSVAEGDRA